MEILCPNCGKWYNSPLKHCQNCKITNPTYVGRKVWGPVIGERETERGGDE
jgi:uncharacterized OB-fold protein